MTLYYNGNTVPQIFGGGGQSNKQVGAVYSDGNKVWPTKSVITGVFGYRIKQSEPDPIKRVEYLVDVENTEYDPCLMDFSADIFNWGSWQNVFFIPRPCALKFDGTVDYYLDINDFTKKENGDPSDISNLDYQGNFMMEFPIIYTKTYEEEDYLYVYVSNTKRDEDFECWSCKKSDGSYSSYFYLPMFEGTLDSSNRLRSVATSGACTAYTTAEEEATYATANGKGWNTTTWADENLMILLFPLLFKSTNSQVSLGFGATYSGSVLTSNNNSAVSKGMMYGTSAGSNFGMTYLGLHNWWAHRWRRPNGLMKINDIVYVKMTESTVDGSDVYGYNRTGEGYISTNHSIPSGSGVYLNKFTSVGKYGLLPAEASGGSASTYYCDASWTYGDPLDQLFLGGCLFRDTTGGIFCWLINGEPWYSGWYNGASISYHEKEDNDNTEIESLLKNMKVHGRLFLDENNHITGFDENNYLYVLLTTDTFSFDYVKINTGVFENNNTDPEIMTFDLDAQSGITFSPTATAFVFSGVRHILFSAYQEWRKEEGREGRFENHLLFVSTENYIDITTLCVRFNGELICGYND